MSRSSRLAATLLALPASLLCDALILTAPPRAAVQGAANELEVEFIGNASFRISDGTTTLLSDFPYRSGAFDYMTYDADAIGPIVDGVSLISHEHADHWDRGLFEAAHLDLIAHPDIAAGIDPRRVVPWSDRILYKDIVVEPRRTEHTDAHRSYLVTWHGVRMYFTGDTESLDDLLAQTDLDLAFVTPWLAERLVGTGARLEAERVVIYHHLAGERRAAPPNALRLLQGEIFRVPYGGL